MQAKQFPNNLQFKNSTKLLALAQNRYYFIALGLDFFDEFYPEGRNFVIWRDIRQLNFFSSLAQLGVTVLWATRICCIGEC